MSPRLASSGENTESPQTGGNLYLPLHPVLVEPEDLVDDGVEDALLAPPVPGHNDVLLLFGDACDGGGIDLLLLDDYTIYLPTLAAIGLYL